MFLVSLNKLIFHKDNDGYSTLTIPNLKEDDAGIYQCRAENSEGDIVSAANLEVNCKS